MEKEKSLSEKIFKGWKVRPEGDLLDPGDVREAVLRLKKEFMEVLGEELVNKLLDEIFGEELSK